MDQTYIGLLLSYLARMVIKLAEFRVEGPDRMEMPQSVRGDHV